MTNEIAVREEQGILEPGIYKDIPFSEYLKIRAISNSYLGAIDECPAKGKTPRKDSDNFRIGRAFHTITLEGLEAFKERYAVAPTINKRTKEGKAEFALWEMENQDKEFITKEDCIMINEMAEAVLCHPIAREMLAGGVSEETLVWRDEDTGMLCKARPDKSPYKGKGILIDLKSTASCDFRKFAYSCKDYGYLRQAGMYLEGATLTSPDSTIYNIFAFIACEKKPPYRVEVFTPEAEYLKWGTQEFHRLLRKEQVLRKQKKYPNYDYEGVMTLEIPAYLKGELEDND